MNPPPPNRATRSGRTSEFVSSDMAQLASHMERCAHSRGVLFGLKRHLHEGSSVLLGHIVTVAFVGMSIAAVATMLV